MTIKQMTDEQLADLGRIFSQNLAGAGEAWGKAMKFMRLD
jgi:hypothetical protein